MIPASVAGDHTVVDTLDSIVPFLGTLAERNLLPSIDRVLAIVNGAARDRDGRHAADQLALLASLFGWGAIVRPSLEVSGMQGVTLDDLAAAQQAGGALKPIVFASRNPGGLQAFVGPAWLPASEPLSTLGGGLNGIRLDGRHFANLFFSGPAAAPFVPSQSFASTRPIVPAPLVTSWFVRLSFPGLVPPRASVATLTAATGLNVEGVADYESCRSRWLVAGHHTRAEIDAATQRLASTHRIEVAAFRRIVNP
jgi:hypothetical protein